jgi:hypothetical protein
LAGTRQWERPDVYLTRPINRSATAPAYAAACAVAGVFVAADEVFIEGDPPARHMLLRTPVR